MKDMGAHCSLWYGKKGLGNGGIPFLNVHTNTKFAIVYVVAKSYSKRKPCMPKTRAFTLAWTKGLGKEDNPKYLHAWALTQYFSKINF